MSNSYSHTPPPPPEKDRGSSYPASKNQQPKTSRTGTILVSGLVGLLVGVGATLGTVALTTGLGEDEVTAEPESSTSAAPDSSTEHSPEPTEEPTESPDPVWEPSTEDFDIETSVKEQRCFGSAGCSLTIRTEPVYVGDGFPTGHWEVTYEVTGIEDEPMIRTFEVMDDEVHFDDEAHVSVENENFDITTEITDIREGFGRR